MFPAPLPQLLNSPSTPVPRTHVTISNPRFNTNLDTPVSCPSIVPSRSQDNAQVDAIDAESNAKILSEKARAKAIEAESEAKIPAIKAESRARIAALAAGSDTSIIVSPNVSEFQLTINIQVSSSKQCDVNDQEAQAKIDSFEREVEARIAAINLESVARIAREDRDGAVFCPCVRQGQDMRDEKADEVVDEVRDGSGCGRERSEDGSGIESDNKDSERNVSPFEGGEEEESYEWGYGYVGSCAWDASTHQRYDGFELDEDDRAEVQYTVPVNRNHVRDAAVARMLALKASKKPKKGGKY